MNSTSFKKSVIDTLILALITSISVVLNSAVILTAYNLYLAEVFNTDKLPFMACVAIFMTITHFRNGTNAKYNNEYLVKEAVKKLPLIILMPLLLIFILYIFHQI